MSKSIGTQIENINAGQKISNPFPGLRPFGLEDSHLFFGREGQSDEVLNNLTNNRFVAVIGASGSGKSSLIGCGVLPVLYGGFITSAGSQWKIITTQPGNAPIDNLTESFLESDLVTGSEKEGRETNQDIVRTALKSGENGLVEVIKQFKNKEKDNILILVDQFEELFRFKRGGKTTESSDESETFVKLLVEAVQQKEHPVYVVLTMRSDFIGDCSQFQDLTKLINNSNYLIPQMTSNDFQEAIEGPVKVGGARIDADLVQKLLNDVGDNPDQLPILQHSLMRTWDYWKKQGDHTRSLNLSDYEAVGKMEKALSQHANEAFQELNEREKDICQSLFKTLTERGGDNRGIRHPSSVEEVSLIAKASIEEVIPVVDNFRLEGRSFLSPSSEIKLDKNSIIDLSHESLMRIWDMLGTWVEDEAYAVQMYTRLSDAAEMYQLGETSLWRPPDLQLAVSWREKQKPTLTWAQRYNPAFERTMAYLSTSEKEFEAEEQNKIKLQKRALRRTKVFALILGTAAVISLGFMLWSVILREQAEKNRIEAEKQTEIAEKQTLEAEKQKEIAVLSEQESVKQKNEAQRQEKLATQSAAEARRQSEIAKKNESEANRQKILANKNEREALEQKEKAEQASQEAFKRRMLSIAQSMAVKSSQIDRDAEQKALVAYQSYLFNFEFEGISHHADIYEALYLSMKELYTDSFNCYNGHFDAIKSVVAMPKSDLFYSTGSDGRILQWDLAGKNKEYKIIIDYEYANRVLAISPNGKIMACGTDGRHIQLFDLENLNSLPRTLVGESGVIFDLKFTPDGKQLISADAGNNITSWDLDAEKYNILEKTENRVKVLAISDGGNWLAGGSEKGEVLLWDRINNTKDILYKEDKNPIYALAFSRDNSKLVSGDKQGNVKIWNLSTMKLERSLRGHSARISDVKFSPEGNMLASSSFDGTVQLWDMNDLNNQPIVLKDHESWVWTIEFSPDGEHLITGCVDDPLKVWPTKTINMAEKICPKLTRNMTNDEWNNFVAEDITYKKTCKE